MLSWAQQILPHLQETYMHCGYTWRSSRFQSCASVGLYAYCEECQKIAEDVKAERYFVEAERYFVEAERYFVKA
jgi:hypothetical protein